MPKSPLFHEAHGIPLDKTPSLNLTYHAGFKVKIKQRKGELYIVILFKEGQNNSCCKECFHCKEQGNMNCNELRTLVKLNNGRTKLITSLPFSATLQ